MNYEFFLLFSYAKIITKDGIHTINKVEFTSGALPKCGALGRADEVHCFSLQSFTHFSSYISITYIFISLLFFNLSVYLYNNLPILSSVYFSFTYNRGLRRLPFGD